MITRRALAGLLAMLMPTQKAGAAAIKTSGTGGSGAVARAIPLRSIPGGYIVSAAGPATVTYATVDGVRVPVEFGPLPGGYSFTAGDFIPTDAERPVL